MTPNEFVARVIALGMIAKVSEKSSDRIIVGLAMEETPLNFSVWKRSTVIERTPSGWNARGGADVAHEFDEVLPDLDAVLQLLVARYEVHLPRRSPT